MPGLTGGGIFRVYGSESLRVNPGGSWKKCLIRFSGFDIINMLSEIKVPVRDVKAGSLDVLKFKVPQKNRSFSDEEITVDKFRKFLIL